MKACGGPTLLRGWGGRAGAACAGHVGGGDDRPPLRSGQGPSIAGITASTRGGGEMRFAFFRIFRIFFRIFWAGPLV